MREIVTNAITNQSGETLVSEHRGASAIRQKILQRDPQADGRKSRSSADPRSNRAIGGDVAETIEYEQFDQADWIQRRRGRRA